MIANDFEKNIFFTQKKILKFFILLKENLKFMKKTIKSFLNH